MKKLTLLSVSLLGLLFANCSNDPIDLSDDQPNAKIYGEKFPGNNVLLPDAWELDIENNSLNRVIKSGTNNTAGFEYSNGHLSVVTEYTSNQVNAQSSLDYDNQGRISEITTTNAAGELSLTRLFDYTNPVFIKETTVSYNSSGTAISTFSKFIKIVNGNVVESYDQNDTQHNTYQYDTKGNVFSNLNNLNELVLYYSSTTDKVNANNRISGASVFSYNGNVLNTVNYNYTNTYNDQNKIVSSVYAESTGISYKLNYTY